MLKATAATLLMFVVSTKPFADDFHTSLKLLLNNHPRVIGVLQDHGSSVSKMREIKRRQFGPQIDLSVGKAYQRYKKPLLPFTEKEMKQNSIKVTQLLFDWNKSKYQIGDARYTAMQSEVAIDSVRQGLILEAVTAYVSLKRSLNILEFAKQSEKNIKRQTQLEDILVRKGKGYSSNVLQAKTSLAGAQSRRVRAEGNVSIAKARLRAVFRSLYENLEYKSELKISPESLPKTLEEAKQIALSNNRQIKVGEMRSAALNQRVRSTWTKEFRPKIQFIGEVGRNFDKDGNVGLQEDTKALVEVVYSLNGANAGKHAVEVVKQELASSENREHETRDLVLEQVAIAWQNLITARTNVLYLENQMNISERFLVLARKERKNGRRSLLDVLSAETALINAQSDHASASFDILIASFTLVQAMGKLDLTVVKESLI